MRPDALPIRTVSSFAELPPDAIHALFGAEYALCGTERVEVLGPGRSLFVDARPGPTRRLVLDALDRESMGTGPLRLRGPRGRMEAPEPESIDPVLMLPAGLREAWGLKESERTRIGIGALVLTAVRVETGPEPGVCVDRALLLAAGSSLTSARWIAPPDSLAHEAPPTPSPAPRAYETQRRVITENDVRRARMQRLKIHVRPGQIVTPAARSLGRELGLLDEPDVAS